MGTVVAVPFPSAPSRRTGAAAPGPPRWSAPPDAVQQARMIHAFASRLGRATSVAQVHRIIVETAARTAGAEQASLALYHAAEGVLRIDTTHGYPQVLVGGLDIEPGIGIIGAVFRTGRGIRVDDVASITTRAPRRRYRTPAFMALPVRSGHEILGVVCLSDPATGDTFNVRQWHAVRALLAMAGLALDRSAALAMLVDEAAYVGDASD
jgi:GAF domain-containing protein